MWSAIFPDALRSHRLFAKHNALDLWDVLARSVQIYFGLTALCFTTTFSLSFQNESSPRNISVKSTYNAGSLISVLCIYGAELLESVALRLALGVSLTVNAQVL